MYVNSIFMLNILRDTNKQSTTIRFSNNAKNWFEDIHSKYKQKQNRGRNSNT